MQNDSVEKCLEIMRKYEKTDSLIEMLAGAEINDDMQFSAEDIMRAIAETGVNIFTRPDIEYKKAFMENEEYNDIMFEYVKEYVSQGNMIAAKDIEKKRKETIRNIKKRFKGLKFYGGEYVN